MIDKGAAITRLLSMLAQEYAGTLTVRQVNPFSPTRQIGGLEP
jgi:hypothetical protein